jgi:hypothetical protein
VLVERFLKHAAIEREPGQLAIQEEFRGAKLGGFPLDGS